MTHCQYPECTEESVTDCFYSDNETDEPDYRYCVEHAPKEGFCYGCGQFWAGVERFDFATTWGGIQGLCENCDEQVRNELGENDDDEEFEDHFGYYL
ncbi:MAG: hypothetical protein HWQ38_18930 [Nostoc sp. NMS7]|uniref:hypothetical protein n=1 Tax=Nostoc sp. NMS7 TaxID=2815391 RepID=UPI0025D6BFD2|nr:hypothetical protein [Nostoc sp. NMS7]MBN3948411.1 hypothetical protein [Nostoc sp. NMS7]